MRTLQNQFAESAFLQTCFVCNTFLDNNYAFVLSFPLRSTAVEPSFLYIKQSLHVYLKRPCFGTLFMNLPLLHNGYLREKRKLVNAASSSSAHQKLDFTNVFICSLRSEFNSIPRACHSLQSWLQWQCLPWPVNFSFRPYQTRCQYAPCLWYFATCSR